MRLFALAFAGWVMAVPLTSFVRDAVLCRHREAMAHGAPAGAPCWCSDMAGNETLVAAEMPSLQADIIRVPAGSAPGLATVTALDPPLPASPCYAPTPPPPNTCAA